MRKSDSVFLFFDKAPVELDLTGVIARVGTGGSEDPVSMGLNLCEVPQWHSIAR